MTRPMRKAFFSQPAAPKLYVDDVFSTYTYTGNGSTQTINPGIDLAGKGGLVWVKARSGTYGAADHYLFDTLRGADIFASSNATYGQGAFSAGTAVSFTSTGASIGSSPYVNDPNTKFSALIFKKAAKFFDVVVYLGDGTNNRKIAHSISAAPGLVITKNISSTGDWNVFHRSATGDLKLNLTDAQTGSKAIVSDVDATTFTVSGVANSNGNFYVAYIFAHDASADGLIQCGSFTGAATVNLGWEPQYLLFKRTDGTQDWFVMDTMRGIGASGAYSPLNPNLSAAEGSFTGGPTISSTGFMWIPGATASYIYVAIRRSNKPPTSGTQVYNAIARTGTGAAATVTGVGFPSDLVNIKSRSTGGAGTFFDRLRGAGAYVFTSAIDAEASSSNNITSFDMNGVSMGSGGTPGTLNGSGINYVNHFFRRAPGFFDVVCYTGTGIARTVQHGLGVVPELMIFKSRSAAESWKVYVAALGSAKNLELQNANGAGTNTATWNDTYPTASVLSLGTAIPNSSSSNYVAYLFATLPGISKVGSYTGNGASQTINCGFATGARFVFIKRTDAAGDWYVWDSVRGIVAANDPHLSLNITAAEVTTDDSVDPDASGFIVNQVAATNINVSGASYIFLAIA